MKREPTVTISVLNIAIAIAAVAVLIIGLYARQEGREFFSA